MKEQHATFYSNENAATNINERLKNGWLVKHICPEPVAGNRSTSGGYLVIFEREKQAP